MNEWIFRKRAETASLTSLKDWEYMKIILSKAIENVKMSDTELDIKCQKALYELATRSVLTPDRLNNVIGIDNVLTKGMYAINRVAYNEDDLRYLEEIKRLAEEEEDIDETIDSYDYDEGVDYTDEDEDYTIEDDEDSLVIIEDTYEDY